MLDASEFSERRQGDRRRGRKPLSTEGQSTPVTVNLPPSVMLRLRAVAARLDVSVPELIRRAIARELPRDLHI